jgi:hypothetical protein
MNQNEQLYQDLLALKRQYPSVFWDSENQFPIHVVRLNWLEFHLIARAKDRYENGLLETSVQVADASIPDLVESIKEVTSQKVRNQLHKTLSGYKGLKAMCQLLLKQDKLVAIKRPTKNPSEYSLYVLAFFGGQYVGIRTILVES